MRRILVTGGSGYIGTALMHQLAARPDTEEIVDVDLEPPRVAHPKVRHVERSVTEDLRDLFTDPARPVDVAMHLAWNLEPLRDAQRQREICIGGSQRFLDGCAAGDVRQVFFMSSATAYGANPAHAQPVDEGEPLKERWHFQYSAEKREAEGLFRRFAADRPGTILQMARPCVVGGPNVSNFIFRAMDKPVAFRVMRHDPPVQLVHEDDCAAALVRIVERRAPGVWNVAGDGLMTLSEAYRRVGARVATLPFGVIWRIVDLAWQRGWTQIAEAPPGFVYFVTHPWVISNRRIKDELGFRFRYTTQETLDAFLEAKRRRA